MTVSRQALIWLVGFVLLGVLVKLFSPILLPFVAGLLIAYFLNPVVEGLGWMRLGRTLATSLVLSGFFLLVGLGLILVIPLVEAQILDLAAKAPQLFEAVQRRVIGVIARLSTELSPEDMERLKGVAGSFAGDALKFLGGLLGKLWSGGLAFFSLLSLVVITPIVAFYMLRDWNLIVAKVDSWLPRNHAETIRGLVREADEMLAGFVRGMGVVCLILAAFYGIALSVIGLDFGLVIGITAGLISFVPFVGSIGGFVTSVGIAFAQFSEWPPIVAVAAVFIAGQILEGNFLTPRLVGERIRLHPVWIIFALLAGGALFGFVGVLLSVPVAAVIGVLTRFLARRYVESSLYLGEDRRIDHHQAAEKDEP